MSSALVCVSHSPLMYCYTKAPAEHAEIAEQFDRRAADVKAFDPELVFAFGPDHYTSFFRKLAPPFCIGIASHATADIGGHAGRLDVPAELAFACASALQEADVDVAVSYDLAIDHGISQTLTRLLGKLDAYPVIPISFNIMTKPLPPFRRSRALGEAVGRFTSRLGKRVLFIGSGGLSHNPEQIFPAYGTASETVTDYQASGPNGDDARLTGWLDHMATIHKEAAVELGSGLVLAADCKLNRELDLEFMDFVTSGRVDRADAWKPNELIEQAGIGSVEIYTWIAACAAHAVAGGKTPVKDIYAQTVEYGVAMGMVHA
jgi:2,3-dihydroxyphenylpropionate 1,2-dioxygenase